MYSTYFPAFSIALYYLVIVLKMEVFLHLLFLRKNGQGKKVYVKTKTYHVTL